MSRSRTVAILFAVLAIGGTYATFFLKNPSGIQSEELIVIPKGMTIHSLTDSLDAHHLLRSKLSFSIAARLFGAGSKLHAGVYRVAYGLSNGQIVQRLTGTEFAIIFQATFPEGITMYKAAQIAHERLHLDSTLFMHYATDAQFLHGLGIPQEARTAEGYLFPDTYQFVISTDPKALITRMVAKWKSVVTDSIKRKADSLDLSVQELMTFASIVEGEARLPQERDTIAGVYWNRLNNDIKLDADPTVQYGLGLTRPLEHDDLSVQNPYNTYLNPGLPPGPVNNPGAAAIRAVLQPAHHNKLFFVARRDGSGGHYFSRTLKEQDQMINQAHTNAAE